MILCHSPHSPRNSLWAKDVCACDLLRKSSQEKPVRGWRDQYREEEEAKQVLDISDTIWDAGELWRANNISGTPLVFSGFQHNHPSVSVGDSFQDPQGYQNLQMLKSLLQNGIMFVHNIPTSFCIQVYLVSFHFVLLCFTDSAFLSTSRQDPPQAKRIRLTRGLDDS